MIFTGCRLTVYWVFRLLFGLRVQNLDQVPRDGPAIIAANHRSYLDGPLLGSAIGKVRRFYSLGKKELFEPPLVGWFLRALGGIPVDRNRTDLEVIRTALEVLRQGKLLLIFPEGGIPEPGESQAPKSGVGILAHHSKAPVIPVNVSGTGGIPRPGRLALYFGSPMRFSTSSIAEQGHARAYEVFALDVMQRVYRLGDQRR